MKFRLFASGRALPDGCSSTSATFLLRRPKAIADALHARMEEQLRQTDETTNPPRTAAQGLTFRNPQEFSSTGAGDDRHDF